MSPELDIKTNHLEKNIDEISLMKQVDDLYEATKVFTHFSRLSDFIYTWYKTKIREFSRLGLENTEKMNKVLCRTVIECYTMYIIEIEQIITSHIRDWEHAQPLLGQYTFRSTNKEDYLIENVEISEIDAKKFLKNSEKVLKNMIFPLQKKEEEALKNEVGASKRVNTLL